MEKLCFRILIALFISRTCHQLVLGQQCNQIGPAVIKGKRFFDSNSGNYIGIKGVNYYPRPNTGEDSEGKGVDFFTNEYRHVWERDIEHFKALGVNTVRIYAVDPGKQHDGFFCALKSNGMYAIVGLGAPCENCAIRSDVPPPQCYPEELKTRGEYVINTFSKYDNVLAFSAGNEIALYEAFYEPPEYNAACQKQFLRDMRAYIRSCPSMRQIPVGLVTADINRRENALYYNCRSDPNDELENAEWYGTNVYQHCQGGLSDISELSGWINLRRSFDNFNLNIPVVLTEFGCPNESFPTVEGFGGTRDWLQVEALYTQEYVEQFAGGLVFEFSAEKVHIDSTTDVPWPYMTWTGQRHGIGYYSPEDCDDVEVPCSYVPYPEFDILASKYVNADTSYVPSLDDYNPETLDVTQCPEQFPPLSDFTWPNPEPYWCPTEGSFVCPNTPAECLPNTPATPPPVADTPAPTPEPGTPAPTAAAEPDTPAPSSAEPGTPAPSAGPTLASAPTEEGDTLLPSTEAPVSGPSAAPATSQPSASSDTESPTLFMKPPSPEPTAAPSLRPIGMAPTIDLIMDSSARGVSSVATLATAVGMLCLLLFCQ